VSKGLKHGSLNCVGVDIIIGVNRTFFISFQEPRSAPQTSNKTRKRYTVSVQANDDSDDDVNYTPYKLVRAVTAKERGLMTPMMSVIQAPIIVWKLAINPAYMRVNFINQLFFVCNPGFYRSTSELVWTGI
jgi:hypothetical protein